MHSQITTARTDTCVKWSLLRKLLIGAQQADYMRQELTLADSILLNTIAASVIRTTRDSVRIVALQYDIGQQKQVRTMQAGAIDQLYKVIRRQKRKTVFVGILSAAAGYGIFKLFKL